MFSAEGEESAVQFPVDLEMEDLPSLAGCTELWSTLGLVSCLQCTECF